MLTQHDKPRCNVLVRADSSEELGYGHVKRGLALSAALERNGASTVLVGRNLEGHFIPGRTDSHGRMLWLPHRGHAGGSVAEAEEDAEAVLSLCAACDFAPDAAVLDHYDLGPRWEQRLRREGLFVAAIDDFRGRAHEADLVVLPVASEESRPGQGLLCGPEYLVVDDLCADAAPRHMKSDSWRVVLFFGSADASNETARALDALDPLLGPGDRRILEVDVVIGAPNPRRGELAERTARLRSTRLIVQAPSLAPILARTDLFITAAGNAMVEALAMGIPTISVETAANQRDLAEDLARVPLMLHLGPSETVSAGDIRSAILRMPGFFNERILPALSARPIDTRGAGRIAEAILDSVGSGARTRK